MILLTEEGREKGSDGHSECLSEDLPLYTGGGVNNGGVAGAMKGRARRDPLFTRGGL